MHRNESTAESSKPSASHHVPEPVAEPRAQKSSGPQPRWVKDLCIGLLPVMVLIPLAFLPYAVRNLVYRDFSGSVIFLLFIGFGIAGGWLIPRRLQPPITLREGLRIWVTPIWGVIITALLVLPIWLLRLRAQQFDGYLEMQFNEPDRLMAIWFSGVCPWLLFSAIAWGVIRAVRNGRRGER